MCEIKTGDPVLVWDYDGQVPEKKVYLYTQKDGGYICQSQRNWDAGLQPSSVWGCIKPAPKFEKRVLDPVAMMQGLRDRGYVCSPSNGDWQKAGAMTFFAKMFSCCGKRIEGTSYRLDPWMLEDVEVK